jgi:hypothetical protein
LQKAEWCGSERKEEYAACRGFITRGVENRRMKPQGLDKNRRLASEELVIDRHRTLFVPLDVSNDPWV